MRVPTPMEPCHEQRTAQQAARTAAAVDPCPGRADPRDHRGAEAADRDPERATLPHRTPVERVRQADRYGLRMPRVTEVKRSHIAAGAALSVLVGLAAAT